MIILTGCSVDPVTGKRSLDFYSESQEIQMGQQYHEELLKEYMVYKDDKLQKYVQDIVTKIGASCDRPNLDYKVLILDTNEVNAFAIPGGHVYVLRGILPYFNSESELACVLAHEIGHVCARHGVESQSVAALSDIGLKIGALLIGGGDNDKANQTYKLSSGISQLGLLSYSREHEMEADRLGVKYSARAGFSPLGMEQTMKMFERMSNGTNPLMTVLSTHPASDVRAKQARIEVRKLQENTDVVVDLHRDRYLEMIAGVDLGVRPTVNTNAVLPKLTIYTVQSGETWESLTKKFFSGDAPVRLAWMNGCELSEPVPAQIKVRLF